MKKILFVATALVAGVAFAAGPAAPTQASPTIGDDARAVTAGTAASVKKCKGCHGKGLIGKKKAPKISGHSKEKLLLALGHGIAPDKVEESIKPAGKIPKRMKGVVKKLSDADKEAIAALVAACPKEGCPTE